MATDKHYTLAGVMGWPVAHSRSPAIHSHWIGQYGLSGAYVLPPVAPDLLPDAVRGLRALGLAGCNLTIPHKVAAMALVDRIDPLARRIGAVNTLVVEKDGALSGYNTDAFGYIQSLLDAQPDWRADTGPVTVLGAGGASRAVIVALAERGAKEIRLYGSQAFSKSRHSHFEALWQRVKPYQASRRACHHIEHRGIEFPRGRGQQRSLHKQADLRPRYMPYSLPP